MNDKFRILLVEDEALISMCLEMELTGTGYGIYKRLATGEDAVAVALQDLPDCIIMDIRLSGSIDGIEAAERIRANSDIPIIFMTGYPDKTIKERARKTNPLGYFVKPLQAVSLKPLIDSLCQEKGGSSF